MYRPPPYPQQGGTGGKLIDGKGVGNSRKHSENRREGKEGRGLPRGQPTGRREEEGTGVRRQQGSRAGKPSRERTRGVSVQGPSFTRDTINLGRPTSGTDQKGIRCDEYSISKYVYHVPRRPSLPVTSRARRARACAREGRGGGERIIAPFSGEDFRGGRWPPWSFVVGFREWSKDAPLPHISTLKALFVGYDRPKCFYFYAILMTKYGGLSFLLRTSHAKWRAHHNQEWESAKERAASRRQRPHWIPHQPSQAVVM